jgi:hypothetical protein
VLRLEQKRSNDDEVAALRRDIERFDAELDDELDDLRAMIIELIDSVESTRGMVPRSSGKQSHRLSQTGQRQCRCRLTTEQSRSARSQAPLALPMQRCTR